jgi:hypothetical protein
MKMDHQTIHLDHAQRVEVERNPQLVTFGDRAIGVTQRRDNDSEAALADVLSGTYKFLLRVSATTFGMGNAQEQACGDGGDETGSDLRRFRRASEER